MRKALVSARILAMHLSAATRNRLARLKSDLRREFAAVPKEHIDELVDESVAELLKRAQFDDFVPLLTSRRVRERLLAEASPGVAEAPS